MVKNPEQKHKEYEEIRDEILKNWYTRNRYLGIPRSVLVSLSTVKIYKIRRVLALMRKLKLIHLEKRKYFVNEFDDIVQSNRREA